MTPEIKENTWCECDQLPGLHNPCDCDNERPVTDPIGWLKFQFDDVVPGKTDAVFEVTITPYYIGVNQETTVEEMMDIIKSKNLK